MDRFILGTYNDTELGSLEVSTEVISEGNFGGFLLGAWLGSVVGLVISLNKGTVLGSCYVKIFVTTLGDMFGI